MLNTTLSFVNVAAIRVFALIDEWSNFTIETSYFLSNDVPELELPDSRGINNETAGSYRIQRSACGSMFAFLIILANMCGGKFKVGIDRI